jgi:hypothetical protein
MIVKLEQEWYTLKEVGERLKMTPVTVARHFPIGPGVIDVATSPEHPNARYKKPTRRHLRISADALERWMREHMPVAS